MFSELLSLVGALAIIVAGLVVRLGGGLGNSPATYYFGTVIALFGVGTVAYVVYTWF